ncbi:MAG TPA: hypothetical protein VHS78_09620 [Candidatus Elarobacter sp.]|jgi:hypothetical protein|nr:hypothetical protein [Candidatus Elarobacter sp.]
MKNILGAQRPASRLKSLSIAVAAIVLVVSLGTAAFSQLTQQPYFTMDTSNVMGMMPPTPVMGNKGQGNPPGNAGCASGRTVSITQTKSRQNFSYVAAPANCVWLIKRNGTPWLTVVYNTSTSAYELTDPNGAGALLLKLSAKPGSNVIKVNPPASSTQ